MANQPERKFVLVGNHQGHIDGCILENVDGKRKTVILYPGYNEIASDLWARVEQNPHIKLKLEARRIDKSPKAFSDLSAEVAAEVVKNTSDPRLLKVWKSRDDRPAVRTAIEDRLVEIFGDKAKEV